ncbi:putative metallocarboxypeptidase ecm14 [Paramyrothecium foliicola]|nr:putative metallocarboxypeptidase ecm14 [Paramyrothecium foliicola]
MKLRPNSLIASLLVSGIASGAGIGTQHLQGKHHATVGAASTLDRGGTHLFPFLTRLRDSFVELIFGQHPTKASQPSAPHRDARTQYANELVLRFNITNADEETSLSDAVARLFLDVWAYNDDFVDIRLHTDEVAPLLGLLPQSLRTAQSTLIPDLAAAVYQSRPFDGGSSYANAGGGSRSSVTSLVANDNLFFQDYQPIPVIIRWMRLLEAMFPTYVEYTTIGKSYEGRDIPALRVGVSSTTNDPSASRKTIVVTGGLHAREWISTSTVNYVAWSFITAFGKESMITKLLHEFDIVFIPIVNPDGVEYTWNVDRLWRKSRQQTDFRFCRGMDLDHAFGYEWDGHSAHNDPCSESYGGEKPFQAVEAMELAKWARNQSASNVQFVGLLDLHSYSQQVLFPYSFSCEVDPPNLEKLEELGAGIAKAIRLSNGEPYSVSSACEGMLLSDGKSGRQKVQRRIESPGGSAIDWFYHEMQAHFSYQIKLRDTGAYGFLLPKEYIIPTGEEVFNAMKYFGDYLLGNNGIEKFGDTTTSDKAGEPAHEVPVSDELRRRRVKR